MDSFLSSLLDNKLSQKKTSNNIKRLIKNLMAQIQRLLEVANQIKDKDGTPNLWVLKIGMHLTLRKEFATIISSPSQSW